MCFFLNVCVMFGEFVRVDMKWYMLLIFYFKMFLFEFGWKWGISLWGDICEGFLLLFGDVLGVVNGLCFLLEFVEVLGFFWII